MKPVAALLAILILVPAFTLQACSNADESEADPETTRTTGEGETPAGITTGESASQPRPDGEDPGTAPRAAGDDGTASPTIDMENPPPLSVLVDSVLAAAQEHLDAGDALGAAQLLDRHIRELQGVENDPEAARQCERLQAVRDELDVTVPDAGAVELRLMRLQRDALAALEANDAAACRSACEAAQAIIAQTPGMEEWRAVFRDILRRTETPQSPPPEDGWGE